jgi:hypothetical protein
VNYQSEIERKIQLEDVRSGILTVVKRKNLLTLINLPRSADNLAEINVSVCKCTRPKV